MIWIPNDKALLKTSIRKNIWKPFIEKHNIPVIVGVENILSAQVNLGTYAVLPDHMALALQAADLIRTIRDNQWIAPEGVVEPPISIYQAINPRRVPKNIDRSQMENVDKIVK